MIKQVKTYLLNLQADICQQLTQTDGKAEFIKDTWEKDNSSGSGITRVLKNGRVFEQAGVNFSIIYGNNLPKSATQLRPELAGRRFSALGVSVVVHPQNPYVPTSHMNVRFFIAKKDGEPPIWWFGGGFDLTPFYGFDEDCIFWHQNAKDACDPFGKKLHPKYKKWCDEYFYMPHRDEQRGIGGLFFDDFNQGSFNECFAFMQSIGNSYINAYLPIVEKRKDTLFSENQRQFQLYRRGRYVEFNLIYDRGTLFGLQTGGRTESILMSLPPKAAWQYQFLPKTNSQEQKLTSYFLKPQNWLSEAQSQR